MKHFYLSVFILLSAITSVCASTPVITLQTLLQEMSTRDNLAQYPSPYYVNRQCSSYDRATTDPTELSWFANWDRSMFVRVEQKNGRKEYVMMDEKGPGVIVRFWMTFAGPDCGKGTLRIYLDGQANPVIEGSALDILSGGALVGAPLATSVSDLTPYAMRGHDLYLPIPYRKSCKVTYESKNIKDFGAKTGGEAVYYNINYRTYEPNTQVVSFNKRDLEKNQSLVKNVQNLLQQRAVILPPQSKAHPMKGEIAPSQVLTQSLEGQHEAIRKISFRIEADHKEQALRSTLIAISFDGHKTVECPLGDFFGTGYQIRPSHTWYTHVDPEGNMSCYWVMPYKGNCVVTLENRGNEPVRITRGEVTTAPFAWNEQTLYFGTSWKQYTQLPTGEFKNNEGGGHPFDINYITLTGKGVYVGDGITLFNTVDAWWGEGDEKVYVDGESFPSHIGTGTEDYYGYAWCRPECFSHPFISQPDGSGNFHAGYTVNLRFRNLDAIPFRQSLRFDMEMWHWVHATINFAPVTFWYIHPDDADRQQPSDLKEAERKVALTLEDMQTADNWYRGNTHAHSNYSDGDSPATEVIEWYKTHGYQFLFVTDHNYPLHPDTLRSSQNDEFILIPGNEISDVRAIHTSALGTCVPMSYLAGYKKLVKEDKLPASVLDSLSDTTQAVLEMHARSVLQAGGIPVLNHPNFLRGVQAYEAVPVHQVKHLEVFNGHPLVFNDGNDKHVPVEVKWDSILSQKHLMYGLASDDTHALHRLGKDQANPGRGWIMVKAKALSRTNILQAIRCGDFYASSGVFLSRYAYNKAERSLLVDVDIHRTAQELHTPATSLQFRIYFIGYNGKVLHVADGAQAVYQGKEEEKYMRVRVECSFNGQKYCAWGQPIELTNHFFN